MLSSQQQTLIVTVPVTEVKYVLHQKPGSPESLRVDYYAGLLKAASEWVCIGHDGYPRQRAESWWRVRSKIDHMPSTAKEALEWLRYDQRILRQPAAVILSKAGKYPQIISHQWEHA